MPETRRCPTAVRDDALGTVLAAFCADPLLRWVWPEQERYDECASDFFGLLLDLRLAGGEVWVAGADDGAKTGSAVGSVAMWDPPGGLYQPTPPATWVRAQSGFTERERRAWAAYDAAAAVPPSAGPHWYLGVLATHPARQGAGLARAVTAPMLAAADRTGLPAYLETSTGTNVAVYRRLGFEVEHTFRLPDGGPDGWLLRREPKEAPR